MLICGGNDIKLKTVSNVYQVDGSNLNNVKVLHSMEEPRQSHKAVCLKGEVYVFGGRDVNYSKCFDDVKIVLSIEKYSSSTNSWIKVADMYDERKNYCACAFIDKIFIVGGVIEEKLTKKSCLQFDAKDNTWKEVTGMNEARQFAASTVFQGNIVVAGGKDNNGNKLDTVESFDVITDKWSSMPNMLTSKSYHSLVVVRNKLFVMGTYDNICEVFDNNNGKFVALKLPKRVFVNDLIGIGNTIVIFPFNESSIFCYDFDKDELSEVSCKAINLLYEFSSVKLPRY